MYHDDLRAHLSPAEHRVFKKLRTPSLIQDYLDHSPINFELAGETNLSPRRVLREKRMHCLEGAVFAAACLAYHGKEPLLMDLRTQRYDDDHVVALFKENGLWGAMSKTNHAILRWRDPVYKTVRELAMSYFHEYFLWKNGKKTLRAYSKPFNLKKYGAGWVTDEKDLDYISIDLDDSPHFPIAPKNMMRKLRPASLIERKSLDNEEWHKKGYRN
ncbi:hypothetical protein H7X87_04020 [Acetobacteraceae bacterium]|nr:hypothetical protein [Candidatus Parcubacteria bacterium]